MFARRDFACEARSNAEGERGLIVFLPGAWPVLTRISSVSPKFSMRRAMAPRFPSSWMSTQTMLIMGGKGVKGFISLSIEMVPDLHTSILHQQITDAYCSDKTKTNTQE